MISAKRIFSVNILAFCLFLGLNAGAQEPEVAVGDPSKDKKVEALYYEAVKARSLNDEKLEEELLKEVIKQNPDEAAPYYDLASLSMKRKDYDKAEQYIKKAVDRNQDNPWYQRLYAITLEMQSKPREAAEIYQKLARTQKHNPEYFLQAAKLFEKSGRQKEAIEVLDEMMKKVGQDDDVLIAKQEIYLRDNKLEDAVKIAQQLVELHPKEGRFYMNLADLYDNNGQSEKAIAIYEKAAIELPKDPVIQFGLANYYKGKGDTVRYIEYIEKAILNQEFDDATQVSILIPYLQELNADSARRQDGIKLTGKLAAQNPNNAEIAALYGQVLYFAGETRNAAEQFKKALAADPSQFNMWQQLLLTYSTPADADSLVKYSEKALRAFPNQAVVHYFNGIGHFNKKNYGAAAKSINRGIDLQPDEGSALLADMYSTLGDIYNAAKNYKESDSSYERALRLNPENASVLNNYAYYLSVRGERLKDAERMSKRSLDLRPGEATFLDTYGWILYKQGNYQEAKKYIEDAMKANPDSDGTVWEHLGDIEYKLGNVGKAVEHWKKAKETGTENTQIDKKIQDKKLYE